MEVCGAPTNSLLSMSQTDWIRLLSGLTGRPIDRSQEVIVSSLDNIIKIDELLGSTSEE